MVITPTTHHLLACQVAPCLPAKLPLAAQVDLQLHVALALCLCIGLGTWVWRLIILPEIQRADEPDTSALALLFNLSAEEARRGVVKAAVAAVGNSRFGMWRSATWHSPHIPHH